MRHSWATCAVTARETNPHNDQSIWLMIDQYICSVISTFQCVAGLGSFGIDSIKDRLGALSSLSTALSYFLKTSEAGREEGRWNYDHDPA